ncbi:MAG: hypothetical protein AAFQ07_04855 [Chloroflexota bacterium]
MTDNNAKQNVGTRSIASADLPHTKLENLHITEQGLATVTQSEHSWQLHHPAHKNLVYSNAQISDYDQKRDFRLRPKNNDAVYMRVVASASTANLRGTAGFGFWNHPFAPGEFNLVAPQALWFFFSSDESNMQLAQGVKGHGWKAATINANRWQFFSLLPTAPLAMPLMNIPAAYDALWHIGQDAIGVREKALNPTMFLEKHTYEIIWRVNSVTFKVDGETILESRVGIPHEPLGFIAWLDNQYAVVTPKGNFGFGLVDVPQEQTLILHEVTVGKIWIPAL